LANRLIFSNSAPQAALACDCRTQTGLRIGAAGKTGYRLFRNSANQVFGMASVPYDWHQDLGAARRSSGAMAWWSAVTSSPPLARNSLEAGLLRNNQVWLPPL
jgi:hypothetical protein